MNKHILLVLKWLADNNSVSKAELEASAAAAYATADAADYAAADYAEDVADWSTYAADNARYWVDKFFEATGENRDDYIAELSK